MTTPTIPPGPAEMSVPRGNARSLWGGSADALCVHGLWLAMLVLAGCTGEVGDTPSGRGSTVDEAEADEDERDDEDNGEAPEDEDEDQDRADDEERDAGRDVVPTRRGEDEVDESPKDAGTDAADDDDVDGGAPTEDASVEDDADAEDCERAPANGLRIREVALYQTLKIPLFKDGSAVSASARPAPIVQGKKSLVRVFVETLSGYKRHEVHGVLKLKNGDEVTELTSEESLGSSSSDEDLGSTFTFQVDGALIADATEIGVALEEPSCADEDDGTGEGARFPDDGTTALDAELIGKLRIVMVPIQVNGRLPNTDEAEMERFRQALLAYYPVPDVELTVRAEPIVHSGSLSGGDSRGWSNILTQVGRERGGDQAESDVYYYGMMQPAESMRAFCARGCILGIAPQTTRVQSSAQIGLGASFSDNQSIETMVHEIGHAHGRGHAPCAPGNQIQGVDRRFPDRTAATGIYGWDSRNDKIMSPTSKDIMGYCQPNWISAYTYTALAERCLDVNRAAFVFDESVGTVWHHVLLYADGGARWGGMVETSLPGGEIEPAHAVDASGSIVEDIEVVRVTLAHTDDQFLYVPKPKAGWTAIALKDRVLPLAAIQPAL